MIGALSSPFPQIGGAVHSAESVEALRSSFSRSMAEVVRASSG